MRGGFAGCAASAINPTVSSTATTMFDKTAAFLIAHLMLEAITQAVIAETIIYDRRETGFIEGERLNSGRIEL